MPKSRNPKIEIDRLQMFFREPYVIDVEDAQGVLTIYQPSIGDVIRLGEKKFFQGLSVFTTNTTANRLRLWEAGLDWNTMSDFELFQIMLPLIDEEVAQLFFEDVDLSLFERHLKKTEDKETIVLYNEIDDIEINETVYFHISQYLRAMFNIYPEEKITNNSVLKGWYIDQDKRDEKLKKDLNKDDDVSIINVISAYLNHPGTKYKSSELRDIGVYEFYDAVSRLQIYEQSTALMKGAYSGFIDSSKLKQEDMNFMRSLSDQ